MIRAGSMLRRNRPELDTPLEGKIRDLIHDVEAAGSSPLLTRALIHLQSAKESISDFVEIDMEQPDE